MYCSIKKILHKYHNTITTAMQLTHWRNVSFQCLARSERTIQISCFHCGADKDRKMNEYIDRKDIQIDLLNDIGSCYLILYHMLEIQHHGYGWKHETGLWSTQYVESDLHPLAQVLPLLKKKKKNQEKKISPSIKVLTYANMRYLFLILIITHAMW